MGKSGVKTDKAKQFRDQHGMDMPTLKAARILYKENPKTFKDVEDARFVLRYIEGKASHGKDSIKNKKYHMEEARPYNPYALPESDAEGFIPYILPFYSKVFNINDVHLPYHDIPALTAAIDFGLSEKPDAVFINGDLVDIHQLSYFQRDPEKKKFNEELETLEKFMGVLNDKFKCKIYYKFGNHEERYERYLKDKAKELVGVDEFELENIIKKRADCEIIKDKRIVINNGLPYVHGHEFGRMMFSPVNAARGLFMQAKHSAVKGDCHTTSEHTEPDIFGKIMTTYSIGALCGLTPKWLPINKWNHGCAMQYNSKDSYSLVNKRIYKGKIL